MFFSAEHKEAHCLLEKFIGQQFSFSLLHFGYIFWVPLTFERYQFRSEYDPAEWISRGTARTSGVFRGILKGRNSFLNVSILERRAISPPTSPKFHGARHVIPG